MTYIALVLALGLGYFAGKYSQVSSTPNEDNKKEVIKEKISEEEKKRIEDEKNKFNKRIEILETCLSNIDAYDGTGLGQQNIPYEDEEEDLWT